MSNIAPSSILIQFRLLDAKLASPLSLSLQACLLSCSLQLTLVPLAC